MSDNIKKSINLNVCIDGVILYADPEFYENGNRKATDIYPITHCRDFRENDTDPAPSPVCDSGHCSRGCPFNDGEKERMILEQYASKLDQCLLMIEKNIYG